MNLILIRHGQTDANLNKIYQGHLDVPMNETGVEQCLELAGILFERYKFDSIYSSPLKRAHKTAQIISKKYNLVPILNNDLKEIDFGKWEGLSYDQIALQYPIEKWIGDPFSYHIDGGEKWVDFTKRINKAIDKISKNNHKTCAIVTHGGVIMAYLADKHGLKGLDMYKNVIKNGGYIEMLY